MMDDNFLQWLDEQIRIAAQLVQKYEHKDFDLEDEWYIRQRTLEDARDAYTAIQTPGSLIDYDATLTADEAAHAEELAGMDDDAARGLNAFMCGKG